MTLRILVRQLVCGLLGDDVAQFHLALSRIGREVPFAESSRKAFGEGTLAVLKALQQEFAIPDTGIVDAATVEAINARLAALPTAARTVRGRVLAPDGGPFTRGFVQVFAQSPDREQPIGRSPVDRTDGSYEVSYQPPPNHSGRLDIRVAVMLVVLGDSPGLAPPAPSLVETTPSGASILTDAGLLEVVDFVLTGEANRPLSEFDLLLDDLQPRLGVRRVADLKEDGRARYDVSRLAHETGYSSDHVAALTLAHGLTEQELRVPAQVFYGLLRQGLPADIRALQGTDEKLLLDTLKASVNQGLVPEELDGRRIEAFLADFKPTPPPELKPLLGHLLADAELPALLDRYFANGADPERFWKSVATDPSLAGRADALKLTVQIAGVTNANAGLVAAIRERRDITQPADLTGITGDEWKSMIRTDGVGVPPETPGATDDEKVDNYAREILTRVKTAFTTPYFARRLPESSEVRSFLLDNPAFDLETTHLADFVRRTPTAPVLSPEARHTLQSARRVQHLTKDADATRALLERNVVSARDIVQTARREFVERHKDVLPADAADRVYDRALRVNAVALAIAGKHSASMNGLGMHALPRIDGQLQAEAAAGIPDWETLFGAFDFCACQECASAHGPAAYLVDILQFLGARGVRSKLFDRRADLGRIELSCENTNTPLPLIDLVNELLEDAVAPPAPFTSQTLAATLEADLAESVATPDLTAAFVPPLRPGARVEVLEPKRRWRVSDQLFTYSVVKEGGALTVAARSRQTIGSAAALAAEPQYINDDAYAKLATAVFPWSLPFDLPFEQAKVFLTHLGVSRAELMEALRPTPGLSDPSSSDLVLHPAIERLGLTETERKILVGEALTPSELPSDFWGGASAAALETVQDVLDRSGLSYAELDALLATWFVNPDGALMISAAPGAPVDTCNTQRLRIDGLDDAVLSRVHRFVRLWRCLGWSVPDLDRAVRALVPTPPGAPVLTDEVLVGLDRVRTLRTWLRLSVVEVLALWRPIDTTEPGSLYDKLFHDPAVFKLLAEPLRLNSERSELVHAGELLTDHAEITDALKAMFRLDAASFELLVTGPNGTLSLANLSLVYRRATLARRLSVSVEELLTAIELTRLDPFRVDRSQDTLRFVEMVRAIKKSGFSIPKLDYLVRHRANQAASFVPEEATLTQVLKDMRASLTGVTAESVSEEQKLRESTVTDKISAALGLPADVTVALLGRVSHGTGTAMQQFLALAAATVQPPLSHDNAGAQLETLEQLMRIASLIQTLGLPGTRLEWLFADRPWLTDASASPAPVATVESWYSLVELQQLRRDLDPGEAALEAILGALHSVAVAADQTARLAARNAFVETLSTWLGWPGEDLRTLLGASDDPDDIGLLKARMPDDYRGVVLVVRLHCVVSLVKRLSVTAARASEWCEATVSEPNAKAMRATARSRHDDEAWLKIAPRLQDPLRERRRELLVAWLVEHPEAWRKGPPSAARADASELYAHFLVDVEMCACQPTSRIKLAISSVQLFVQRYLMGLEGDVLTGDPQWAQWVWMKNYRVWEANRKIFLYPENWIEPELRDDKTPFFKELESELLQTDLTDESAEQAFRHYLEKLDTVARLQVIGEYEDADKVLHVFARTFHTPPSFYYRRYHGPIGPWTPWEKVELDIEGNHFIPVVWNRKLMAIWVIFNEKARETPVVLPNPGEPLGSAPRYWELQLAWSEYQNGRWTGRSLSEGVAVEAYKGRDVVLFGGKGGPPTNSTFSARILSGSLIEPESHEGGNGSGGSGGGGGGGGSAGGLGRDADTASRLLPEESFVFKTLVTEETLSVRAFVRFDHRATPGPFDGEVAHPIGEFRFFGCRKIVTTVGRSQLSRSNFPLAPKGMKFDRMGFAKASGPLTLLDGTFPEGPVAPLAEIPTPSVGDPVPTLAQRHNIPVFGATPTAYQLLTPHQDLQFLGDRPFFFMDRRRAFMGFTSGKRTRPAFTDWVNGDFATAWSEEYFPLPAPAPSNGSGNGVTGESEVRRPLSLLVPGPRGTRVIQRIEPVNLEAKPRPRSLVPKFWTTREYTFENFHHPYVCKFLQTLDQHGVPALLSLATQSQADGASFDAYLPEARVVNRPKDEVEFRAGTAYEVYNWELFFHIPLLIATRLSKNQRFEEARRWFHFIFDPTGAAGGDTPQRYWRTKPFHDCLSSTFASESAKALERMLAQGPSKELLASVEAWRNNPFSPHVIARLRETAYPKAVVMKYIDNLVAWGDQLFRRETIESINEATQLYVLAAEILGRRPKVIERNLKPKIETFDSIEPRLREGGLGNVLAQIELVIGDPGDGGPIVDSSERPDLPSEVPLYFCVPENYNLLAYWDTVSDRLFKIRHCMNIEGQVRQLPLFEPPIDPALLVRARAAGVSISDVLQDVGASALPNYRFSVMLQKANELVSEVRNLGSALLSALEKRDAEALTLLRSVQELGLLQAVRDVRKAQQVEAQANFEALEKSREIVEARKEYYEGREFMSSREKASSEQSQMGAGLLLKSAGLRALAAVLQKFGTFKFGAPTTMGPDGGSAYIARALLDMATVSDVSANIVNTWSQMMSRQAEYGRRKDEWDHQANLAAIELKQIEKQIVAAETRRAIAEQELRNHDQQIDNARETDEFLRSKFTGQDLFGWMVAEVSGLYFQSYQLAYDVAKRAELCMQHELGLEHADTAFIRFGYWDSLKKGLLAGDRLAQNLRRLEVAYLDGNSREYELTKHVSLVSLDPMAFIELKEQGSCEFEVPEWLFDLDTPGHFLRRIKSTSLTIPCVTGPYTGVHCKLQLLTNSYRKNTDVTEGYARSADESDERFVDDRKFLEAIVTSTAQNDAGLFEPTMRDERYLPFEGAGAVSQWRIELPTGFRAFDHDTISDVILHLRYTARDGGSSFGALATESAKDRLATAGRGPLFRLFSLRHEFPSAWHRFMTSASAAIHVMTVDLAETRFPYFAQNRGITVGKATLIAKVKAPLQARVAIAPGQLAPEQMDLSRNPWPGAGSAERGAPGPWTFGTDVDPKAVEEVFVIFEYSVG